MMRDGILDAIIRGGSAPGYPKFAELALTTEIDLFSIDTGGFEKIFKANPSLIRAHMPPNLHKDVKAELPAKQLIDADAAIAPSANEKILDIAESVPRFILCI